MKKLLMLSLLALLAGPRLGWAATATPTPNATLTQAIVNVQSTQTAVAATATYVQTAFPTYTPTQTPTGTLTPSPTFTPAPKQLKNNYRARVYFTPLQLTNGDGKTILTTTADPGGPNAYLAQALSQTVAVLTTGTAEIRLGWTVPWNFKGDLKFFAVMNAASIGDSVTLTASVAGQHFNETTQTAGTFSYVWPGGLYYMIGTATNVLTAPYGIGASLQDTPAQIVSRVLVPTNSAVSASPWNQQIGNTIQPGDFLNLDIVRTSGGSGVVNLYGIEAQYDYYSGIQP
ncbi:hypothetical protein KGP36_02540 [Patescibacteria group bacterium]|nr:hypothetical protein [Patescibacteria group bacterium]